MALVEKFHVVAAERQVASGQTIKEGQVVSLNNAGEVVIQSITHLVPYGIAGDTKSTTASSMPGIGTAVIGGNSTSTAVTQGFQNRASDYFDETKASAKMTVYHNGGEFATDMFSSNVVDLKPYTALYANSGYLCSSSESTASGIVGYLTQTAGSYPSGVPGTAVNGDQALSGENTNQYIEFKLSI